MRLYLSESRPDDRHQKSHVDETEQMLSNDWMSNLNDSIAEFKT